LLSRNFPDSSLCICGWEVPASSANSTCERPTLFRKSFMLDIIHLPCAIERHNAKTTLVLTA
jgi:hypothetical protein